MQYVLWIVISKGALDEFLVNEIARGDNNFSASARQRGCTEIGILIASTEHLYHAFSQDFNCEKIHRVAASRVLLQ